MVAYDDKAEYDVPSDGTVLPELLPVDSNDEPGMSHYDHFSVTTLLLECTV